MKMLLVAFIILVVTSLLTAQDYKIAADIKNGEPLLLGYFPLSVLINDTSFSAWWNEEYDNYGLDYTVLDSLEGKLEDISIKIVLRTTCSDSREQVPRFFKILNELSNPVANITLIGVDRKKNGLSNESEGLEIEFVPTFIFYKDGTEIGRIVETPIESLERDMVRIIMRNL